MTGTRRNTQNAALQLKRRRFSPATVPQPTAGGDEKTDERTVDGSKDRRMRRMRTRGDKRPSRKNDRKVLMAEESTKSWADTDSDSSSSSSSSSDSEQEEVHCLMADQTSDDEVFDFSNIEFTREDLVSALNDMVKEYRKLSHTFEEVKAENDDLKNSSVEPSIVELGEADSLKIELRKTGIGYQRPENSKPSWLKNKLDKDKAKAGSKSFASNQPRRKKREMTIEFRLLCDILAKTISVKAGSFDAITQEKFFMLAAITCGVKINWNRLLFNILKDMVTPGSRQAKGYAIQINLLLENVPINLELGESSEFSSSKILIEKTVHLYISLNDKVGMEDVTDEPRVKKTPVRKAVSKKRPAVTTTAEPVVKKKRTTRSKSGSSKDILEILPVAQEVVPLQIIEPTPAAPAEQPPVPKRKIQKRKRKLVLS
ncbi:hypothetical protein F511_19023 [Dorcoceras hygrometricum]|uniref:Uncharacterized protein n=1 Tax=Dorcoceras hygrometricum TaxID=472368 RepID=A0A2Z7BMU2_9LAMI|nr:hypothetical protein F511_19023 [Dorcoceras hygrometricum]